MVSSNEVKALMLNYFPSCPICFKNKGYDVLGVEDYVSCKKCNATWQSEDFKKGVKLSQLTLTQPSSDGTGRPLLRKIYSIEYWRNWRELLKAEREEKWRFDNGEKELLRGNLVIGLFAEPFDTPVVILTNKRILTSMANNIVI